MKKEYRKPNMLVLNCETEALIADSPALGTNNRVGNGIQLVSGVTDDRDNESWSSSSIESSGAKDAWVEW